MFTATSTHPASGTPKWAASIGATFGSSAATRSPARSASLSPAGSPGPRPSERSPSAIRIASSPSSAYVIRRSPSTTATLPAQTEADLSRNDSGVSGVR